MPHAIWYHLYHFRNVKNTHEGVLLLVQLQATKSNTPPWVFLRVLNCTNGTKSRKALHLVQVNETLNSANKKNK